MAGGAQTAPGRRWLSIWYNPPVVNWDGMYVGGNVLLDTKNQPIEMYEEKSSYKDKLLDCYCWEKHCSFVQGQMKSWENNIQLNVWCKAENIFGYIPQKPSFPLAGGYTSKGPGLMFINQSGWNSKTVKCSNKTYVLCQDYGPLWKQKPKNLVPWHLRPSAWIFQRYWLSRFLGNKKILGTAASVEILGAQFSEAC